MTRQGATRRSDPAASTALAAVAPAAPTPFRGYFLPEDLAADRWVHLAGLILCTIGIPLLLDEAGHSAGRAVFGACAAYAVTLAILFACSTAFYHVPLRVERRRLRQLDHAAIFLLIAGTYTPFTATLLPAAEAVATTGLIWLAALCGAIYKLRRTLAFPGFSTAGYAVICGTAAVGLAPVLHAVDPASLLLIIGGLVIYGFGAVVRTRRSLRYRNTIWHGMVVVAASCHYAAILHGVVLSGL
ncbi:MAG TPA: hemolysin III family protein [Stellaceae bacterium]|nr:hemolysin III family protein [Stellaceae bacterium]